MQAHERPVFPVALILAGEVCLVDGGGQLALARVETLLAVGAEVRVAAPQLCEGLLRLRAEGRITHLARAATEADVEAAFAVFVARDDFSFDAELARAARRARRLLHVVDVTEACNFYLPALLRRGPLTVAVSTSGCSPMLAARLRSRLAATVGPEYGELAQLLGELRSEMKARCPEARARAEIWRAMLDSEALELLADGRRREAEARLRELLPAPEPEAVLP